MPEKALYIDFAARTGKLNRENESGYKQTTNANISLHLHWADLSLLCQ